MPEKDLAVNLKYVEDNKKELFKTYPDKFVIVYEQRILNSFDTYDAAATEAINNLGAEANFLIYHLVRQEPLNFVMEAAL